MLDLDNFHFVYHLPENLQPTTFGYYIFYTCPESLSEYIYLPLEDGHSRGANPDPVVRVETDRLISCFVHLQRTSDAWSCTIRIYYNIIKPRVISQPPFSVTKMYKARIT